MGNQPRQNGHTVGGPFVSTGNRPKNSKDGEKGPSSRAICKTGVHILTGNTGKLIEIRLSLKAFARQHI